MRNTRVRISLEQLTGATGASSNKAKSTKKQTDDRVGTARSQKKNHGQSKSKQSEANKATDSIHVDGVVGSASEPTPTIGATAEGHAIDDVATARQPAQPAAEQSWFDTLRGKSAA